MNCLSQRPGEVVGPVFVSVVMSGKSLQWTAERVRYSPCNAYVTVVARQAAVAGGNHCTSAGLLDRCKIWHEFDHLHNLMAKDEVAISLRPCKRSPSERRFGIKPD